MIEQTSRWVIGRASSTIKIVASATWSMTNQSESDGDLINGKSFE